VGDQCHAVNWATVAQIVFCSALPCNCVVMCCVGVAVIDDEDLWSVFMCPAEPLVTFSVVSPGSPFPPVQVCLVINKR